MPNFFSGIFGVDHGKISKWMAGTLSTDELIEKVIFKRAFAAGLYFVSPAGVIVSIDVPFFRNQMRLHHISDLDSQPFSEGFLDYALIKIDPEQLNKISKECEVGSDPWQKK